MERLIDFVRRAARRTQAGSSGEASETAGVRVRETVTIRVFDHTPQPGEQLQPLRVVVSERTRPVEG